MQRATIKLVLEKALERRPTALVDDKVKSEVPPVPPVPETEGPAPALKH